MKKYKIKIIFKNGIKKEIRVIRNQEDMENMLETFSKVDSEEIVEVGFIRLDNILISLSEIVLIEVKE